MATLRQRFGLREKFISIVTTLLLLALAAWGALVAVQKTHQVEAELLARGNQTAKLAARLSAEVLLAGSLTGLGEESERGDR